MGIEKVVLWALILLAIVIFLYLQNNLIGITKIRYTSRKLPKSFGGFRIIHLSDLHNKLFGRDQEVLISKIIKLKPDLIVITGDLVDSSRYNAEISLKLIDGIKETAPVYYVPGNHEEHSGRYLDLEQELRARGVKVLRNTREAFTKAGEPIEIVGIDCPEFSYRNGENEDVEIIGRELRGALGNEDGSLFKILLSHRPELLEEYAKYKIDLAFSGHAHGGQIRVPFIGGLYAPNQGVFPKYTSGAYKCGELTEIVSRGLGNSSFPQRIFNRPEVILTILHK